MMRLPDPRDDVLRNDGIEKRKSAGETPGGFAAGGRARAVPLSEGRTVSSGKRLRRRSR
jgi:hypothetical protein